ncbi:MAG TPA: glutamine-hydrolyzing carbamoyl-phosphate synthase small subunit [Candidatus Bathyarchaeia archaeon]|nr:glutamine-hydrolyzing carbamoyl-phosphate synthase small subunit [Candidatus Bathyarchaeia archaeon]
MDGQANAVLALEDGTILRGKGFGAHTEAAGEVVFNTAMIGYPELLTDPSYHEQIVVMTYPILGSYGVPRFSLCDRHGVPLHFESESVKVKGYVAHSLSTPSHWSSEKSLSDWLADERVPGIFGIDTRYLTQKLRVKGTMLGFVAVSDNPLDFEPISEKLARLSDPNSRDLVGNVSIKEPIHYVNSNPSIIVVVDCGVKYGILRSLLQTGTSVIRVPYDYSASDILELEPQGIIISNGPGDPKKCLKTIETARALIETDLPVLGICLGAQILGLAAGADTYKLRFGHRAVNHPCLDLRTGRCYITTQNHGYTIRPESLPGTEFQARFVNMNDKTIEGITHNSKNVLGIQWHPESSPGPYDTTFLFEQFLTGTLRH